MSTSPSPAPAFPDPVEPAETVELRRSLRTRRLIGVSAVGIGVRVIVVIAELLVVRATGSATVLVDALATVADIVGSLVIVAAIKFAERPPDDDHPFGHGRFEPLAGLQLGLAMTVLGAALAIEQLTAPFSGGLETAWSPWLAAVPLAAAAALALTGRLVLRHGRRERSTALVAEAYHYRVDAVTSLCAAVGLL
ncbi:MAG: cation diffusion facilitator family transporter, partial [Planctomycetota bacterium]